MKNLDLIKKKYKRRMIIGVFNDLQTKQLIEKEFIVNFQAYGGEVTFSLKIISPFKKYSNKETKKIIIREAIDGILIVALKSYWETKSYIPKRKSSTGSFSVY